jgi:hypothetical protein
VTVVELYGDAMPSTGEMMSWISEVVDFGVRRPGSSAGHRVEEWCLARFRELGLSDVRREPFDVPVWEPGESRVVVWPEARPQDRVVLAGFALPHTQPSDGHEAALARLDPTGSGNESVAGAIAVDVIELGQVPSDYMRGIATGRFDPSGHLDEYVHLLPFSFRLGREVDTAIEAGATGYIGVLTGLPWDSREYYLPYDAVERPVPAVWVDRRDGAQLMAMLAEGPVVGRIEVEARRRAGWSSNVIGTLPGASDEWVIIGSHHDAPWASAVEDGSGIALVLAQARFWAEVPAEQRPHSIMFLLNGGHMAGAAGMEAFGQRYREMLDQVVLSIHLEHTAVACSVEQGRLVPTDEPEVRWWFTSREPRLEAAVRSALAVEELERSWILPPEAFGEFPPTDGGELHLHGVPLVDFLVAPAYLVDSSDTIDKVHQPSLGSVSRAAVRIVDSLTGRTAAELRSGARTRQGGSG